MTNKEIINNLKDYAELAQATYGYFHLAEKKFKNKKEYGDKANKPVTLQDILDSTYYGSDIYSPPLSEKFKPKKIGTLKGDMTPTQSKRFFDKYDLLDFYPKFDTKI